MDVTLFWGLIGEAKAESGGECEREVELLRDKLITLPPEEIVEFHNILTQFRRQAYSHDLWAAAYIINGGCSDDCFDYFGAWLIAQGEEVYSNTLRDPETLAEVAGFEQVECESLLSVADEAYEEKTGEQMPHAPRGEWALSGEDWDEETVYEKYPRLAQKFS